MLELLRLSAQELPNGESNGNVSILMVLHAMLQACLHIVCVTGHITGSDHVEGCYGRMMAHLLHKHDCAIRQLGLPGLPQDGIERLAP